MSPYHCAPSVPLRVFLGQISHFSVKRSHNCMEFLLWKLYISTRRKTRYYSSPSLHLFVFPRPPKSQVLLPSNTQQHKASSTYSSLACSAVASPARQRQNHEQFVGVQSCPLVHRRLHSPAPGPKRGAEERTDTTDGPQSRNGRAEQLPRQGCLSRLA